MKQALIFFSLPFIFASALFSQEKTLDYAYLKCQYHHTYLKDTLDVDTYNDLFILQIGKNISKWYSYYTFQADSLRNTPDGDKVWKEIFNKSLEDFNRHRDRTRFLSSFPRARSGTFVYKNYPRGEMTVTDGVVGESGIYRDTLNAQQWQIGDSTRNILGYACQMAECDFRGRHWTVWFAPDVPISDGPWKLGGLPGLIMEAYDRGKQYYFVIVELEQVTDEPIVFSEPRSLKGKKFREVNRRELLKAKMYRLTNGASISEAEFGISFGKDGPVYMDLIERDYR